ncbi:lanthionine synthetase LanC family protein [uncultured Sphingobacterium sp.]|uniref:lanthionine synthetase LanC family protein n=1 Tax=uncultured Sphingobacterium sp. TaxID=182688 RepID=UPI00374A9569
MQQFKKSILALAENLTFDNSFERLGLDKGVIGMIFTAFSLYEYTSDEKWKNLAQQSFSFLEKKYDTIRDTSFRNGAIGIGWGIESLSHLKYLNLNTDEYLVDFDNLAYKLSLASKSLNLSLDDGCLGIFSYITKRYDSRNFKTHRFKRIYYQDCLVMLSNRINSYIKIILADIDNIGMDELNDLCNVLTIFSSFYDYQINKPIVEEIIYSTVTLLYKFSDSNILINPMEKGSKTLLLLNINYSLIFAGIKFNSDKWFNKGKENFVNYYQNICSIDNNLLLKIVSVVSKAQYCLTGYDLLDTNVNEIAKFIQSDWSFANDKCALIRYMISLDKPSTLPLANLLYI